MEHGSEVHGGLPMDWWDMKFTNYFSEKFLPSRLVTEKNDYEKILSGNRSVDCFFVGLNYCGHSHHATDIPNSNTNFNNGKRGAK
jgi:hypothetical protein